MVIRDVDHSPFWLKVDGTWVYVDEEVSLDTVNIFLIFILTSGNAPF